MAAHCLPRLLIPILAISVLGLTATAEASTVTLKCGGKGPRNKDSSGTVLCAAKPGKARVLEGVARDDSGHPVATKVTVTFSKYTPAGGGAFTIRPSSTKTIRSKPSGKFSLAVKTSTRVRLEFGIGDEAASLGPSAAIAEVSRRLAVKIKKLGGGKVKLRVAGLGGKSAKIYVLDRDGYEIPGVPAKKAGKAGSATFNLGRRRGVFSYYVDVGVWGDLYWYEQRRTFKL